MFSRLGRFVYRRRKSITIFWALLVVVGFVIGGQIFNRVSGVFGVTDAAESIQAEERLEELGSPRPDIVALIDGVDVTTPALERSVTETLAEVRQDPHVVGVIDFYSTELPQLVAKDGNGMLVVVDLDPELSQGEMEEAGEHIKEQLKEIEAPEVLVGGELFVGEDFRHQSEKDLQRAEIVSMPIVLIVLVVIFGGFVAAGLPLFVAAAAVAGSFLLLFLLSLITDVSVFAINVASMLGLGLAVDYALLIVNRFREERARGRETSEAVERTVATAGMTVAFSGLTVAVSMCGLLFLAEPFFWSLAFGGIGVVLIAMLGAITLLPATLGMVASRIKPAKQARANYGFFYRVSRLVQKGAVPIVAVIAVVLALLAVPFSRAKFEIQEVDILPAASESKKVFEARATRFPGGSTDPIEVVAEVSPQEPALTDLAREISGLEGVANVFPVPVSDQVAVLNVTPEGRSQGDDAVRLVDEIRALDPPFDFKVGGKAAELVDWEESILNRFPFALGWMAIATFILLFLMTGSIVVPIKAMIMNVLSLGASFGALVWVFQDGNLSGLLNFTPIGTIDLNIPVLIFVFAFGLSMDYEVFLLSRIKEVYDESHDNDQAVAVGLQRTGRIVTSAAILIVVVFAGFVAGELLPIKQLGFGLSLAVALDATIIRTLLVPASMRLMGHLNWWAPAPMKRFHEKFGLHEPPSEPPTESHVEDGTTTLTPTEPVIPVMARVEWGSEAYEIAVPEMQIGRNPQECEVLVHDSGVAWLHAEIALKEDHFELYDLGSEGGTYVNGNMLTMPHVLADGDRIRVGATELTFRSLIEAPKAEPAPVVRKGGWATTRSELADLARSMDAFQILRVLFGVVVLGSGWFAVEALGAGASDLALGTAVYLIAVAAADWVQRGGARPTWLFVAMLLIDGIFLTWAAALTGGTQSPLLYLFALHVIAMTLFISYRVALKVAVWHTLGLFLVFVLEEAKSLPDLRANAIPRADDPQIYGIAAFWIIAIVVAGIAMATERRARGRTPDARTLTAALGEFNVRRSAEGVAQKLLETARDLLGFERGVVLAGGDGLTEVMAYEGEANASLVDSGVDAIVQRAWDTKKPVLVRTIDAGASPRLASLLPGARNVVVIPLLVEGEPAGALVVEDQNATGDGIERQVVTALEQIALFGALSLRNAWDRTRLHHPAAAVVPQPEPHLPPSGPPTRERWPR